MVNYFVNSKNELVQIKKLISVKRLSCKCDLCSLVNDRIKEEVKYNENCNMYNIEDGKLYKLKVDMLDEFNCEYKFVEEN